MNDKEDVKKEEKKKPEEYFRGVRRFQGRNYFFEEVHGIDNIVGNFCIFIEVPEVKHDPMIFVGGIRYHDNYPDTGKDIKRPFIFKNHEDCARFASALYFPDRPLIAQKITREIANHKLFGEVGAYLVSSISILVP